MDLLSHEPHQDGAEAQLDARDDEGCSVLWRAVFAAAGCFDLVRLLSKSGARDDLANLEGVTPRALAERLGFTVFTAS